MMLPHEGVSNGTPTPRNDSPASMRMFVATMSVKRTSTVGATLGRISLNITRHGRAP